MPSSGCQSGTLADVDPSLTALLVDASERFLGEALGRLDAAGYGGLSVSHAFTIQLIEAGVATITALSAAMRMTPQAVSAIVNQLDERGLVTKGRQQGDARTRILSLTDDGRHLADEITAALRGVEGDWADLIGVQRLTDVKSALAAYVSEGSRATPALARRRPRRVRFV